MSDKVRSELMRKADPYRWNDRPAEEAEALESAYMLGFREAIDAALSLPQDEGRDRGLEEIHMWLDMALEGWQSGDIADASFEVEVKRALNEISKRIAVPAPSISQGDGRCWISAKDQLPRYGQPVILFSNGAVQEEIFERNGEENTPDFWDRADLDNSPLILDTDYWMPLPPPPNAEPAPAPEGPKEERGPYSNCTTPGTDCHAKNGKYCMNMMQCRPLGQAAHPASASGERAES